MLFPVLLHAKVVIIDPGHDGEEIVSHNRTDTEVNTNWEVANKLANLIASDPNLDWQVVLTRTENDNDGNQVGITARKEIANKYKRANPGEEIFFLSIHCNGGEDGVTEAHGTESFYCNQTFNTNDQLLVRYASNIEKNIEEYGELYGRNHRCVEDATYSGIMEKCTGGHLCVLNALEMPNCLNEIGFVTNNADKAKLLDDNYRNKFAFAYLEALKATFSDLEVVDYSFESLPCFQKYQYLTKISMTVKNVSNRNFYGDVRTVLRSFPYGKLDPITQDFYQLGNSQYIYLAPGQQTVLSFSADVPNTMEVGMALCVEAKKTHPLNGNIYLHLGLKE